MRQREQREILFLQWCFAAVLAVRLGFPRLFGVLDNDSLALFIDAQRQLDTGAWSLVSTLPVWLVKLCYQLMGQSLASARWVSVLAGLGVMLLLYLRGLDEGDRSSGTFASLLFGVAPIGIFFGTSALPYGLLTFAAVLGIWLLARGQERGRWAYGPFAGLALGAAFLCKTFAAALVLPVAVLFMQDLLNAQARRKLLWLGPLLAGLAWAAVVGFAVVWRWPIFGASVFNDYVTDWRFDIATAVWHARWVDLVTLHALMLPLLVPGLYLAIRRGLIRPFDRLAMWLIIADLGVFLANPVNHFPRVLLPAVPFLAWFAGRELAFEWRYGQKAGSLFAWALTALATAGYTVYNGRWMSDGRPWTVLVAAGIALVVFLLLRVVLSGLPDAWREHSVAALLIVATFFGLTQGYLALDRVERGYAARIEALRFLKMTDGVLGGGDVLAYVAKGRNNFANLLDLPHERLVEILDEGLPAVLAKMRIRGVIVDRYDSEGAVPMLAGVAQELGRNPTQVRNPFDDLDHWPYASRVYDNGLFAAYRLETGVMPESDDYPQSERVLPAWDCTGLMTTHPTAARLAVIGEPTINSPYMDGMDRTVLVELTDRPGDEEEYEVPISLENANGERTWARTWRVIREHDDGAPGVRLYQFYVSRTGSEVPESVVVPLTGETGGTLRVGARPTGGAQPLWVLVRLPAWW